MQARTRRCVLSSSYEIFDSGTGIGCTATPPVSMKVGSVTKEKIANLVKGNLSMGGLVGFDTATEVARVHVANTGPKVLNVDLFWDGDGHFVTKNVDLDPGKAVSLDLNVPPSGRLEARSSVHVNTPKSFVVTSYEVVSMSTGKGRYQIPENNTW